ncbi:winged helix-turn-helix transcriptional regulator [Mycolicibacterium hodleri]|uniref:winged helix-turn-helix transcriptional regulator n=1 Tax=Mycolicibacterium hodleri TaxID=49897 RepID=UPI001F485AF9|nr:helix-turn-helix domain-containing protein [Mycolicibacterium hodleri]
MVATLAIIGDRWTLLILREAFFGVRRFGEMQRNLGVSRTVLSARLKRLTAGGLFERIAYRQDPVWYEYRLTPKGLDLWPAVVALLQWGDRHLQTAAPPLRLRHLTCGTAIGAQLVCASCGDQLRPNDTRPERT